MLFRSPSLLGPELESKSPRSHRTRAETAAPGEYIASANASGFTRRIVTPNAAGLSGGSLRWQLHRRFSKTESGEVKTDHHIGRLPSPKSTAVCCGLGPNGDVLVAATCDGYFLFFLSCGAGSSQRDTSAGQAGGIRGESGAASLVVDDNT